MGVPSSCPCTLTPSAGSSVCSCSAGPGPLEPLEGDGDRAGVCLWPSQGGAGGQRSGLRGSKRERERDFRAHSQLFLYSLNNLSIYYNGHWVCSRAVRKPPTRWEENSPELQKHKRIVSKAQRPMLSPHVMGYTGHSPAFSAAGVKGPLAL